MAVPRFCLAPRCPQRVEGRSPYCPEHAPAVTAWASRRTPRPASNWEWRKQRRRALIRDRHRCVECGSPAVEVDHIVPRSRGGTDDLSNLRSMCRPCHKAKSEAERLAGLRARRGT